MRILEVIREYGCGKLIAALFSYSCLLLQFVFSKDGKEYRIGPLKKLRLAVRIGRNNIVIKSLSTPQQHLLMVKEILALPRSLKGEVVECGCYNGASTANLSLACALTNRRLIACDSFEGLPTPTDDEKYVVPAGSVDSYVWQEGEFCSEGGLEGLKNNVEKFGKIEVCEFVKGYFENTLGDINTESIVLVFEDADMASSVQDCLRYLWPKLREGCKFYCHEPWSTSVVSLFYNKEWWENNLGTNAPGFFGSGHGIIAGLMYSNIGYAEKFDAEKIKELGKKIVHCGSKGFRSIGGESQFL